MLADIPRPVVGEGRPVLADWSGGEDAALWTIDERRIGILTVDFITPVVDDPFAWGQVAAANSISDVFAMGGRPIVALNVVGFPTKALGLDVLAKILEGGAERTRAAGAFLAGGHSVQDDEPKYGLVVYGEVERDRIWRTVGGRPGDQLILTKPLGTGIAITAIKADMIEQRETVDEAIHWMTTLNSLPLHMGGDLRAAVHAATDVTGFGLAGHVLDMLSEGGLDCRLSIAALPALAGVKDLADMGLVPEGAYRNRAAYEARVDVEGSFRPSDVDLLFDAQTSGGLLLAVAPDRADELLALARARGFDRAAIVGALTEGEGRLRASYRPR